MAQLAKKEFDIGFPKMVKRVAASEKITKADLREWCNHIVHAMHTYGHIDYMNKLIAVLSPMNKRTCVEFFKTFAGYKINPDTGVFEGKDKKKYLKALADWQKFSADPLNNIWVWSERHLDVVVKPFTTEDITKRMSSLWKSAHQANISNVDILKAVLSAKDKGTGLVFSLDDIITCLTELDVQVDAMAGQSSQFVRGDVAPAMNAPEAPM